MRKHLEHPEVMPDVLKEFHRLHKNNPSVDGKIKFEMAIQYVRTIAEADTALLNMMMTEEI